MNELKDIAEIAEGYGCDEAGFEVVSAHKGGGFWNVELRGYKKEGERSCKEPLALATLFFRFENPYSTLNHWTVVKAEALTETEFDLVLKRRGGENEESVEKEGE